MSASSSHTRAIGPKTHSSYEPLRPLMEKYPKQSGPLFHAYTDLKHVARWERLEAIDLKGKRRALDDPQDNPDARIEFAGSGWGALRGQRPEGKKLEIVVPCHIADNLSTAYFDSVFECIATLLPQTLPNPEDLRLETETEHIILAILSPDSTVVYYKLAKGLVKPVN